MNAWIQPSNVAVDFSQASFPQVPNSLSVSLSISYDACALFPTLYPTSCSLVPLITTSLLHPWHPCTVVGVTLLCSPFSLFLILAPGFCPSSIITTLSLTDPRVFAASLPLWLLIPSSSHSHYFMPYFSLSTPNNTPSLFIHHHNPWSHWSQHLHSILGIPATVIVVFFLLLLFSLLILCPTSIFVQS